MNDLQAIFENYGINICEADDSYRPFIDVMVDLAGKWKSLNETDKHKVSVAMTSYPVIGSKLAAIEERSCGTSDDLAEAVLFSIDAARNVGVEIDRLLGYLATLSDVTMKNGEVIGTAMTDIFNRYNNLNSYNIESALSDCGISLHDDNGKFRTFGEVMDVLHAKWGDLKKLQKFAVSNAMAGIRHSESFRALMKRYHTVRSYTDIVARAD